MSATVNEAECEYAGLQASEIQKIADKLHEIGRLIRLSGVTIFGVSGSGGLLLKNIDIGGPSFVLAEFGGPYDGGDDAPFEDSNGMQRIHK